MPEIQIAVKDKLPTITGDIQSIVANNSDYTIRFEFDEQWSEGEKTVYFVRSNGYVFAPVMTEQDVAAVPVQYDVKKMSHLWVGIQQGNIKTSAPVVIPLRTSVTELINDDAVQPEPEMWENVIKRIERLEKYGGGGSGLAYEIGFGLSVSDDYVLSAEVGTTSFAEIPNTKVQEIFNKVMQEA